MLVPRLLVFLTTTITVSSYHNNNNSNNKTTTTTMTITATIRRSKTSNNRGSHNLEKNNKAAFVTHKKTFPWEKGKHPRSQCLNETGPTFPRYKIVDNAR